LYPQARSGAKSPLPFAIMTSDDTHARTKALLEEHKYFGLAKSQVGVYFMGLGRWLMCGQANNTGGALAAAGREDEIVKQLSSCNNASGMCEPAPAHLPFCAPKRQQR
jgi:hypothetical protein